MTRRDWLKVLLGLLIGLGLMALIALRMDWARVAHTLSESRPLLLIPLALCVALHYLLKGLRWHVLLQGDQPGVSRVLAIRLTMVGFLANSVIPLRLGELSRPYLLSANHPGVRFSWALATVVGDKLFDMLLTLLCLLGASIVLVLPETTAAGVAALGGACIGITLLGLAAAWWRRRAAETGSSPGPGTLAPEPDRLGSRIGAAITTFADGLATISSPRRALLALIYSLFSFALLAAAMMLAMEAVNLEGSPLVALFVIGMVGIALALPAPPTHLGSFHFFAAQALTLAAVADPEVAFAFAVIAHSSQVVVVGLLGVVSLIGLQWRRNKDGGSSPSG